MSSIFGRDSASEKDREKKTGDPEETTLGKEIVEYLKMIVTVVCVVLILETFLIVNARIPSGSMLPNIREGDQIIANRLAYFREDPQRFDVVIFKFPDDESKKFIKRVIGLPGETVEIIDGKVYINGSEVPLDDSFVAETPIGSYGPYVVPEDSYFMMGDNRNYSNDSRFWNNHYVEKDQILGKAVVRYWPLTRISLIS